MAGLNSIAPAVLDAPAITASPDPGDLLMRRRPARGVWRLLKEVLKQGGPGYIQFAITSHCNARCRFCGFALDRLDPRQRQDADGAWWGYEAEPNQQHHGWYENEVGRIVRLGQGELPPDWTKMLVKRGR